MIAREELVKEVQEMLRHDHKCQVHKEADHIGLLELRWILDEIYNGKPENKEQELVYGQG